MRHVLVINPNTRQALTTQLIDQVGQALGEGCPPLMGATAAFGADYIASESSYVVAALAVVDAWHRHVDAHGRPRAVLVACFGDPGVWALRESAGVPVIGLAEAAMQEADALGPFAIVTGGSAWGPMLERLARALRLSGPASLRCIRTVDASGGELAADPDSGRTLLLAACRQAMDDDEAYLHECAAIPHGRTQGAAKDAHRVHQPLASIILGGAALGGWAEPMAHQLSLPLIDSVMSGARWLQATLARGA